jgi:predicted PurR-regulated permease PerM
VYLKPRIIIENQVIGKELVLPLYIKPVFLILGLIGLVLILYIAQGIIVPLVFAILISILLHPVVNFFVRLKINRLIAIIITMALTFLIIGAFAALLFSQASRFSDSWPVLVEKFTQIINESISWASGYFNINPHKIHDWITQTKGELINGSGAVIGQTIISVGGSIVILFLIPVYVFMILFYHPLLIDFIRKSFAETNQTQVREIVTLTKTVIQRYLVGLFIEFVLMSILNTSALLILGIQYAILLGIIGALLNVIPYIGGLIAVALPIMVALVTKSSGWYALYVLAAYYFIQLIDNNYIVPKIVASKVKINALFSILAVIAGNALWGVPGMFLSIPLLAIIKLIFDHIKPMQNWGFLLGDTMPPLIIIKPIFKKILKKSI